MPWRFSEDFFSPVVLAWTHWHQHQPPGDAGAPLPAVGFLDEGSCFWRLRAWQIKPVNANLALCSGLSDALAQDCPCPARDPGSLSQCHFSSWKSLPVHPAGPIPRQASFPGQQGSDQAVHSFSCSRAPCASTKCLSPTISPRRQGTTPPSACSRGSPATTPSTCWSESTSCG